MISNHAAKSVVSYRIGASITLPRNVKGPFYVSLSEHTGFSVDNLEHFIEGNEFGSRLADALRTLEAGKAIAINRGPTVILVSSPAGRAVTITRRFRLTKEI